MTDLREAEPAPAARRLAAGPLMRRLAPPAVVAMPTSPAAASDREHLDPGAVHLAGAALAPGPAAATQPRGVWTAGREHTATLARLGVWLLVLAGPVSLIWTATSRTAAEPGAVAAAPADRGPEAAVAAAAEVAAAAWFGPEAGNAVTVEIDPPPDPTVAGPRTWSVLVAVTQAAPVADPAADPAAGTVAVAASTPAVTYLQVPMTVDIPVGGAGLPAIAPLGSPALVGGPADPGEQAAEYSVPVPAGDPRAVAATAFVTALLTGGDITPLTAPGSTIRPVAPAAATAVDVRRLSSPDLTSEDSAQLAVTAELATAAGTRTATYYLDLHARDGRWEIAALATGPASAATEPTTEPAPATP